MTEATSTIDDAASRWSVADVHESLSPRSFLDALERSAPTPTAWRRLFDEHDVRAIDPRPVDRRRRRGRRRRDRRLQRRCCDASEQLDAYVFATVSTDSRDEQAQALLSEI